MPRAFLTSVVSDVVLLYKKSLAIRRFAGIIFLTGSGSDGLRTQDGLCRTAGDKLSRNTKLVSMTGHGVMRTSGF